MVDMKQKELSQEEWKKQVRNEHMEDPYIGHNWESYRGMEMRSAMHGSPKDMVTFIMKTRALIRGLQDDLEQLENYKGIVIERTPNTHGLEFILSSLEYEEADKRFHYLEKIEEYSKAHINDEANVTRMAKLKELFK